MLAVRNQIHVFQTGAHRNLRDDDCISLCLSRNIEMTSKYLKQKECNRRNYLPG